MRLGTSYQGKEVVAICFDDLSDALSSNPTLIRCAIKASKMGAHNIAKDFVPINSEQCDIRRGINSRSRKCTTIWLCTLPNDLVSLMKQRMYVHCKLAKVHC